MGEKRMENFALEQVRPEDRKGWISLAFVQMGMIICVPSLLLGCLLSLGMPLWKAIASGTAGYLLTVLLSFPLGMQGADLGIPSVRIAASTFGRKGARFLIGTVMLVSMVGWFGINCNVCGESFVNLINHAFGVRIPVPAASIFWGIVMLVSAVFGMNALRRLDACSLPLLAAIMIGGTVMAFARYGTGGLYAPPEDTMTFVQGVGLSFSFTAAAAVTCADITRFQKNRKETVKSVFWGVMPAGIFTLCLGVLITKATGDYDITTVLASVGLPVLGVLVLILASWTTNSLNAYSAGLDAVMVFAAPDRKRKLVTVLVGAAGILLAVAGILEHIQMFLSLLSYVLSAVGGIMTADYWIVGRGRPEHWHELQGWNRTGVTAAVLAIAAAALIGVDYTGLAWGFLIYLALERLWPSASRTQRDVAEKYTERDFEEDKEGNEEKYGGEE